MTNPMTLTEYLAQVKERLDAATPAEKWLSRCRTERKDDDFYGASYACGPESIYRGGFSPPIKVSFDEANKRAVLDMELIASCPTDLSKLVKIVEMLSECLEDYVDINNSGGPNAAMQAMTEAAKIAGDE